MFTCKKNFNGATGYSGSDSEDNGNAVDSSGADYFCDSLTQYHSNDEMRVVEFFAAKTDIPTGNNKYATSSGFKNKFYQTLHDSEDKYSGTDNSHNNETWADRNMTDVSDGYSSGEYIDSWMIGNATGKSTQKIYSPTGGDTSDQKVFNGGFAGKCPAGQRWQFYDQNNRWQCAGAIAWSFNYTVPNINSEPENVTTGVFLDGKIFETGTDQSLESAWFRQKSSTISLKSVDARCYAGTSGFDAVSTIQRFDWKSVDVSGGIGGKSLVGVTGEIDLSNHDSYTCEWDIKAVNDDTGETVVFDIEGSPEEIKEKYLDDYADFNGFDPSSLCSGGCGSNKDVTGSKTKVEELSAAAGMN